MSTVNYGLIPCTHKGYNVSFTPHEGRWWIHSFPTHQNNGYTHFVFVDNYLDYNVSVLSLKGERDQYDKIINLSTHGEHYIVSSEYIQTHTEPLTDYQIDTVKLINAVIPEYTEEIAFRELYKQVGRRLDRTGCFERIGMYHESITASVKKEFAERLGATEKRLETSIQLSINRMDRSCRNLEDALAEERGARKQFQYYILLAISVMTAVLAMRR